MAGNPGTQKNCRQSYMHRSRRCQRAWVCLFLRRPASACQADIDEIQQVRRHLFGAKMSPEVFGTNASFSVASWWGWPFTPFTADDIVLVKALRYVVPGAAPFFLGVEETMPAGCADRRDRRTPVASRNIHASLPPCSGALTASSQFKTEAAQAAVHGSTASSAAGRLLRCPASWDARNRPSGLALKLDRVCDLAICDCSTVADFKRLKSH